MHLVGRAGLRGLLGLMVVASTSCVPANAALAFDFFGLFGSDNTPKPSSTTLPYKVEFEVKGDDDVKRALQDSSNLYKLVETPPPDGESLVLRVKADFAPLIDALWGAGYYNGRVLVDLAGVPLELGRGPENAAARAANAYRNRDLVPVKVIVETGPQFKLRALSIVERGTGRPFDPAVAPPDVLKLKLGDPARTADLGLRTPGWSIISAPSLGRSSRRRSQAPWSTTPARQWM